jgi:hypothetical protein
LAKFDSTRERRRLGRGGCSTSRQSCINCWGVSGPLADHIQRHKKPIVQHVFFHRATTTSSAPGHFAGRRVYLVPFVEDEHSVFLKTIIPSRKVTKEYLGKEDGDEA